MQGQAVPQALQHQLQLHPGASLSTTWRDKGCCITAQEGTQGMLCLRGCSSSSGCTPGARLSTAWLKPDSRGGCIMDKM